MMVEGSRDGKSVFNRFKASVWKDEDWRWLALTGALNVDGLSSH